ncbi:predicted protein [Thalassiosira pseudonana CCMP1335]|uniref:tRNA (guanine(9)-N(1))-methyltransferase n=1 Tax=Thalassiosira pseudonana TaxID=35128 RepID=B8C4B6_THAPS|nr:predicted protein [Thalassiosira pseudonana CCMP1335]EED91298.1 predicted protein [Thalassiosira pseudonana CCMP1335]
MADDDGDFLSLERLHLHGTKAESSVADDCIGGEDEKGTGAANTSDDVSSPVMSPASASMPNPIILCDAWYGFPLQKRPRKERIYAVSNDVQAVKDRVCEIEGQVSTSHNTNKWKVQVEFAADVDIHRYLERRVSNGHKNDAVYLSPDAEGTLSTTCRPPCIVIIGMLIDRRVTTHRSRLRAEETLNIRTVTLPLDELNVKELTSKEPLNVDIVMELMQRWWYNCDKLELKLSQIDKDLSEEAVGSLYKRCFVEAAAWAMKSQRERHPNRTVHITTK